MIINLSNVGITITWAIKVTHEIKTDTSQIRHRANSLILLTS